MHLINFTELLCSVTPPPCLTLSIKTATTVLLIHTISIFILHPQLRRGALQDLGNQINAPQARERPKRFSRCVSIRSHMELQTVVSDILVIKPPM